LHSIKRFYYMVYTYYIVMMMRVAHYTEKNNRYSSHGLQMRINFIF